MDFATATPEQLDAAETAIIDELPFGVIGFGASTEVDIYSAAELRLVGLSPDFVRGRRLFEAVAPCMNNYLVAQRFEDETDLDTTIDYVLTFKMRPTPVKLRLLRKPDRERRYVLVQR